MDGELTTGFGALGNSVIRTQPNVVNHVICAHSYRQDELEGSFDPGFFTNAHLFRDTAVAQVQLPVFGQMILDAHVLSNCDHIDLAVIRFVDPLFFMEPC